MLYEITYDYAQMLPPGRLRTYTRNVVGECNAEPVGYGPGGKPALFALYDLLRVVVALERQLGTDDITLHLHPSPRC